MFTLAILLGTGREQLIDSIRDSAPTIKRWGGRVLITVGGWFIALGLFADFFANVFPV